MIGKFDAVWCEDSENEALTIYALLFIVYDLLLTTYYLLFTIWFKIHDIVYYISCILQGASLT